MVEWLSSGSTYRARDPEFDSRSWFKQYLLKKYQDIYFNRHNIMFRIEQQDKTSYIKLSPKKCTI